MKLCTSPKAADIIKGPYVLEFPDLPESNRLLESELETALIYRLRDFMKQFVKKLAA